MESNTKYPTLVTPFKFMAAGQILAFLTLAVVFICIHRTCSDTPCAVLAIGTLLGMLISIVSAIVCIVKFAKNRLNITPMFLMCFASIAMFICFINLADFLNYLVWGDGVKDHVDLPVSVLLFLLSGVFLSGAYFILSKQFKYLKFNYIGTLISSISLTLWSIFMHDLNPRWIYLNEHQTVTDFIHEDEFYFQSTLFGILILGGCVLMFLGWKKTITAISSDKEGMALANNASTSAQSAPPYREQPTQQQYQQQYQSIQQPQQSASGLSVDDFLRLQEWTRGLTVEDLKYVVAHPAEYQREIVELCTRELLNRI